MGNPHTGVYGYQMAHKPALMHSKNPPTELGDKTCSAVLYYVVPNMYIYLFSNNFFHYFFLASASF